MLPAIIVGVVIVGGTTGYVTYNIGRSVALPASYKNKENPPLTLLGFTAGGVTGVGAYWAQARIIRSQFSHLMTYQVPSNVDKWKFTDFIRVTGPFAASRFLIASTSVMLMGYVATKFDVKDDLEYHERIRRSSANVRSA